MWLYYKAQYAGLHAFFTIGLLLVGSIFLGYYIKAPETHIAPPIHGFDLAINQTLIHLTSFSMTLDVESARLTVWGEWQYVNSTRDIGRQFNILVILPFTIQANLSSPQTTPAIANWKTVNTNITNVAASAVSAYFSGSYTKFRTGYFRADFIVAKTYANSYKGSYAIVLPLDLGLDGQYFPELVPLEWNENVTHYTMADETNVIITFPSSAGNIQTFPPAKLRTNPPYDSENALDSVDWNMTARTEVSLYYVNQDEQSRFEFAVVVGSILVGAGISGIADLLKPHTISEIVDWLKAHTGYQNRKMSSMPS